MRVCRFLPYFALAMFLTLFVIGPSAFAISVRPAILDVQIQPGERHTGMITITNSSDVEERFRASATHFRLTRDGQVQQAEPDSSSVAEWMKFNPKEFTLAPNARQQIRYTLVTPPDIKTGDYWCVLEFIKLAAPSLTAGDTTGGGVGVNISVSTAVVVPVLVQIGEVNYEWSLLDLKAEVDERGPLVSITLSNTANGRVPFVTEVDILDGNGEVVAHQKGMNLSLFPFSERVVKVRIEAELELGEYIARVRVNSEKADSFVAGETVLQISMKR